MPGGRRRRLREGLRGASASCIDSLGKELLCEIFLRLPSLTTLVRAALTCQGWRRAVASSPSFRRRFRALHPAPFLGVFNNYRKPYDLPVFTPARHRDRDLLAAVRGGDFFLTSLLESYDDDVPPYWLVAYCHDGCLILMNQKSDSLAIFNPLAGQRPYCFAGPPKNIEGGSYLFGIYLISSDEDPMSFRVLWICHTGSMVRVAVYSSETRDWRVHPWVNRFEGTLPQYDPDYWRRFGKQAGRVLYWPSENMKRVLTLNTETLKFSVLELPPCLEDQERYNFVICLANDGEPRIVYDDGVSIVVLILESWEDGVEEWELEDRILHKDEADLQGNQGMLSMVACKDGFVYMASSEMVFSFCLETSELRKLVPRRSGGDQFFDPYFMPWPPSLVGNYGRFGVLQVPELWKARPSNSIHFKAGKMNYGP